MKKYISINSLLIAAIILALPAFMSSCKYDVSELGPKAKAAFTVTPVSGQVNKYALASTSQNAFIYEWDKGTGTFVRGTDKDTVYFPDKGTYKVRLLAYGPGGIDSTTQTITVANDDPAAITPFKILTNNSSKTWKLAPQAGALWIGPSDYSQTWWANSLADVSTRSCLFNDELTFSKDGKFVMNMKGDFYVDEEAGSSWPAGMPAVGCYPVSAIPSQYQAWTGGTHSFTVIDDKEIRVTGTGAYMGLYKAGTPPNAAVSQPQSSVTYQIVSITPTKLVVKLDYGWGAWQFTFVPA